MASEKDQEGPMAATEEDDGGDYLDMDLVEFHTEDFNDISAILKLSDTMKDKLTFTLFLMNVMLTCFIIGYVPNYFYLWHTFKAVVLLSHRLYMYKRLQYHYFLWDFCYFTNCLTLLYIWFPTFLLGETLRGHLFTVSFSFAVGPLMSSVIMWRNSLVPHSADKMTSLFIHVSPVLTLWGIRWYGTPQQNFPICAYQTSPGSDGCNHVGYRDTIILPTLFYVLWQVVYIIVVEVVRKERIEKKQLATSYKWIVEESKKGFLYSLFNMFHAKYRKTVFMVLQFLYTLASLILLGYICYFSINTNIFIVAVIMSVACYNGASFYIDVFSQRYYFEKILKSESKKGS